MLALFHFLNVYPERVGATNVIASSTVYVVGLSFTTVLLAELDAIE